VLVALLSFSSPPLQTSTQVSAVHIRIAYEAIWILIVMQKFHIFQAIKWLKYNIVYVIVVNSKLVTIKITVASEMLIFQLKCFSYC